MAIHVGGELAPRRRTSSRRVDECSPVDENKLNETGNSVVAREMGLTTEAVRRKVLKILGPS